jgi:zinc transport system substrate-binding protein
VLRSLLVVLAALGLLGGCTRAANTSKVDVVASFYPLAFLAERIGGDRVAVTDLTPAGVEPHELELTVRQVVAIHDSDLTVYLHGLAGAVDDAVHEARNRLDVRAAGRQEGSDSHVWLDPGRMESMALAVRDRLTAVDPEGADEYAVRAGALVGELRRLDDDLAHGLASCRSRELVTSHTAFGYLARRYDLDQIGVTGLIPDAEPAPGRMAEVIEVAREHHVRTVFFESVVSPKVAQTVASSIGARTAVLDPIETKPEGGDYLTAMRADLAALRSGLECA